MSHYPNGLYDLGVHSVKYDFVLLGEPSVEKLHYGMMLTIL